jgi:hypothetical protein
MAKEKEQEEVLSRISKGTTRPIEVRLDQIVRDPARYCHRNPEALTKRNASNYFQEQHACLVSC